MNNLIFPQLCKKILGINCIPEYRFHKKRKWRFDFAIPELKIAIEIDGGVWTQGRHNRGSGYVKDLQKFNAAAAMGWLILKFTPDQLDKNETFQLIKETVIFRINPNS